MCVRKGLVLVFFKGYNRIENVDGVIVEKYEDFCIRENKMFISLIFF